MSTLSFPLDLADRCVKCGLCLNYCPTYRLTQDEAESPRGRIALMQGLATGQLAASPRLEQHLDQCLACRNCEPVCPADVPYGQLIDAGRALLSEACPARSYGLRWLAPWLVDPVLRRSLHWLLWLYQRLGILRLFRYLVRRGPLARLAGYLPPLVRPGDFANSYPPETAPRGGVALFTGCVSELAERPVLDDAIFLLNRLGFEVQIPEAQGCCGALHWHNGDVGRARELAALNLQAFAGAEAIVGSASGCSATLREYSLLLSDAAGFGQKVSDLSQFIDRNWTDLKPATLAARVAVQTPCTLRNVMRDSDAPLRLLRRIPGLDLIPLPDKGQCCGAAGSYFLSQPGIADRLADVQVAAIRGAAPAYVVTSNVGCALHLRVALQRSGMDIPVVHPVQLAAQQLRLNG